MKPLYIVTYIGKCLLLLAFFFVNVNQLSAQSERDFIRKGNRAYRIQQWAQAEVAYRKALAENPSNTQALYNLGCALVMQQKDSVAMMWFQKAGKLEKNAFRRAKSYHNMGVILQAHHEYSQAIEAYKQALRNQPADNETRYNLALCQYLLKKHPSSSRQKQNQQNSNNKKQQKQKQNQNQQKDKQKLQAKKSSDRKEEQHSSEETMSRDNAEQLLNAAIQQEQATEQRMKSSMRQPKRQSLPQNW